MPLPVTFKAFLHYPSKSTLFVIMESVSGWSTDVLGTAFEAQTGDPLQLQRMAYEGLDQGGPWTRLTDTIPSAPGDANLEPLALRQGNPKTTAPSEEEKDKVAGAADIVPGTPSPPSTDGSASISSADLNASPVPSEQVEPDTTVVTVMVESGMRDTSDDGDGTLIHQGGGEPPPQPSSGQPVVEGATYPLPVPTA